MESVPVELDRLYKIVYSKPMDASRKQYQIRGNKSNASNSDMQEENNHVTPIQYSQEANFRHIACNDKVDRGTHNNTPTNMTKKKQPKPCKR